MKTRLITLVLFLAVGTMAFSQPWVSPQTKTDGPVNFYELKAAYDRYFESHEKVRGSGYKQFERYAWFMEPRVYPSGHLPETALWEAWEKKQQEAKIKSGGPQADWQPMGPFDTPLNRNGGRAGSGRINCITFHPTDPDIMYAGAPSGGVWKTTDGGSSWTTTTDFLPALGVSDLAIHPDNPDILYMVTGDKDGGNTSPTYSYGILKSTDAGETWNATGLIHETSQTIRMRRLVILNGEEEVLLTGGSSGLFRSVDGGNSWEQIASGNYFDLEIKPDDPSTVYACTNQAIFKSVDAGVSFTRLENGLPNSGIGRIEMAVTNANPEVLYAVATNSDSGFKALYKSGDAGESFITQSTEEQINIFAYATNGGGNGSGIGWYAIALAVDQEDENMIYSGSVNIWKSTDGGQNWTISAHWYGAEGLPYVHADEHSLDVSPITNVCFSGNDGGFYKTTDKGTTWDDLSDGLAILQIYRMGGSITNPERILEGSQDNGTYMYHEGTWLDIMGGDGMECAIDPRNENIMYASYQNGALHRSTNTGVNFKNIRPSDKGSWITPFEVSRLNSNILVAGYEAVYLSPNRGDSWEKISGELAGGSSMNELTLAPSDDRYIYVSRGASMWMSPDRGSSWEKVSDKLPNRAIEYITVAQSEPLKVWVSFSGYSAEDKVYFSEDGGQNWTNYSEGLPNVPTNCLVYKNNSNYSLYAGTDLGVYYRTSGMDTWVPFDDQLPNVIVNELEINDRVNKIRAATFGRGMWESPVIDDGNWPPAIQLTANAGNGFISLDWIPAEGRTPDEYNIYRNGERYTTSQTNSFRDEVENGLVYEYAVKAVYTDGESTPTNSVLARGEEPIELPYHEAFDSEAHGWLIKNKISGWQWGTGADLALNLLGESHMIATNSAEASKEGQSVEDYAILPKMNLAGESNLELRFDYALRRWQDLDHLKLLFRTPDQPNWTLVFELDPTGRLWRWGEIKMDLPAELYADEIELAFHYTDSKDIGYGAAIDNFYIGPETSSVGLDELDFDIDLYPTPAKNQVNLLMKGLNPQEEIQINLSDLSGKVVWSKKLTLYQASHTEQIDLSDLPAGMYQVQIVSGEKSWTKRFSRM